MKRCSTCGDEKPLDQFHKKSRSRDGRGSTCKLCRQVYMKREYNNKKSYYKSKAVESKAKYSSWVDTLKTNKSCSICGESRLPCLDWHHRRDTKKKFNMSEARSHSKEDVLKEVEKCILVCANCHRVLHNEERMYMRVSPDG